MARSTFVRTWGVLAGLCWAGTAWAVAEAEPQAMEEAADTAAVVSEAPTPAAPAASVGNVARSAFATAIAEREPVDAVSELANDREQVAYFTELRGFEGRSVVHRWEYGDEVVAEVTFDVGGPRWRVHSTKQLDPAWLGTWSVSVVADGEVLTRESFEYVAAAPVARDDASASQPPPASEAPALP